MNMELGELDQRITFQERAPGQDALGQANGAWQNIAVRPTVWARARGITGRERFVSGQMQAEAPVTFWIRFRSDINTTMRVLWNGQPHEMVAPPSRVKGSTRWLELVCVAGLRDGRTD